MLNRKQQLAVMLQQLAADEHDASDLYLWLARDETDEQKRRVFLSFARACQEDAATEYAKARRFAEG